MKKLFAIFITTAVFLTACTGGGAKFGQDLVDKVDSIESAAAEGADVSLAIAEAKQEFIDTVDEKEKKAFIDATTEATCMIFEAENIFDPKLEEMAKEIYSSHGFIAENDFLMDAVSLKYGEDEEVSAAIADALNECAGDLTDALGDLEVEVDDTEVEIDEVIL